MTGQSLGKELADYLQPGVAIRKIYEVLEPNLKFADFVDGPIQEDRASFMYMYDDEGTSADSKKQTAPLHIAGADLPRIDFGVPSAGHGILKAKGFEVAIPRNIIRDGIAGEAAVKRTYRKAAYLLAQQIDTAILTAMTGGAAAATTVFDADVSVWSGADPAPVTDLMNLAQDFDIKDDGYNYNLTRTFGNKAAFYELKEYLNFLDGQQFNDQRPIGEMINRDTIYVKQADLTFQRTIGMTDSYILGLDEVNRGAEMHVYTDQEFAISGNSIKYNTIEDGKKVTKSAPNFGLHFYTYMEDATKAQILQFWFEANTVVTQSKALVYASGI
jgi:hypothetical protein